MEKLVRKGQIIVLPSKNLNQEVNSNSKHGKI